MRAYQKPGRPPCAVTGCGQPRYCRGVCTTHYNRLRARGDVGGPDRERAEPGAGSVNSDGYRVRRDGTHPLSGAQGKLLVHREVLYASIGPGDHPCHWCGRTLAWLNAPADSRINVDHIDHVRLNNDPRNLVASCLDCNTKRTAAPFVPIEACRRSGHPFTPENTTVTKNGDRKCKTCKRERDAINAEANRERARRWYSENRERALARQRAAYARRRTAA